MSAEIDLACTVCGAPFAVSAEDYAACTGVVECPGCGSTDLILLSADARATCRFDDAVA